MKCHKMLLIVVKKKSVKNYFSWRSLRRRYTAPPAQLYVIRPYGEFQRIINANRVVCIPLSHQPIIFFHFWYIEMNFSISQQFHLVHWSCTLLIRILWIRFYVSTFIFFTPIKIGKTKYIMQSYVSHHLLKDWKNMLVCAFYFSTNPNNFNGSSIHIQRIAGPHFFCLIARKIVEQTIIKAF